MNIHYRNAVIKTNPSVYEPSEDSFLLADAALSEIKDSERVLEVGCGSSIVAAVIKANTRAKIAGIDINPDAAKCTKENGIDAIRGDLLSCIKGKFDMIIFNPPYLPTSEGERTGDWLNTALDGGYDGRRIVYRFLDEAGRCLTGKGKLILLVSSLSGIEEVRSKMEALGYSVEIKARERFMFETLAVIVATKT
jgi:release factor glutamine methyltransferase